MNPVSEPVPRAVVTETAPLAPAPTVATMVFKDCTVNELAGMPPKLTDSTPLKKSPVMVTCVPCVPEVGVKEVMSGAG